jgi:hypothetical protein
MNLNILLGILLIVAGVLTFYNGIIAFGLLYAFKITGLSKYIASLIQIIVGIVFISRSMNIKK